MCRAAHPVPPMTLAAATRQESHRGHISHRRSLQPPADSHREPQWRCYGLSFADQHPHRRVRLRGRAVRPPAEGGRRKISSSEMVPNLSLSTALRPRFGLTAHKLGGTVGALQGTSRLIAAMPALLEIAPDARWSSWAAAAYERQLRHLSRSVSDVERAVTSPRSMPPTGRRWARSFDPATSWPS